MDWDEEIRKTERIRRKGLFISGLGFAVAVTCIFGVNLMGGAGVDLSRKIIFAVCIVLSILVLRITWRRRERLKREREEQAIERMLQKSQKTKE